jgi:hypothetical protein
MRREVDVTRRLRDYIIARIHIGQIHPGDRLSSYRRGGASTTAPLLGPTPSLSRRGW